MNNEKQLTIKQYIEKPEINQRIQQLLKDRSSQFMITLTSMVNNDPKLQECEPSSLFTAALTVVGMDLPVNNNLGFAWIIPYKDTKSGVTYAQAQLGYKAFIQLAMRSNQFKTLNVSDVREGEYKGMNRLTGEVDIEWESDDLKRNKLKIVGYIAYMRLLNGFEKSLYMTAVEAKAHGTKYSANYRKYNSGMWANEFDAMARKTVIKLLLSKYAPMNVEMAKAQEIDQAVVESDNLRYIDNEDQSIEELAEEKERKRIIEHIEKSTTIKELELCKKACDTNELAELYLDKEKKLLNPDDRVS